MPTGQSAHPVRKAVFPVAGLGTRFLPATKAVAKEMLPIVDRPLIQYAVDEAAAAGIEEMIFITNRTKRSIEDHFDRAVELEADLEQCGKQHLLDELASLTPPGVRFTFVRQARPLGLGHAIHCARHLLKGEPFAVLLPDDLIDADPPALAQMIAQYERTPATLIAVQPIKRSETKRYGVVDTVDSDTCTARLSRLRGIVEKPALQEAPSLLGVVGRYVFAPEIFDYLNDLTPGVGGEIQLTDAIARLLAERPAFAFAYRGKRYDCGTKIGYLEAQLAFGLKDPQLSKEFSVLVAQAARFAPRADAATEAAAAAAADAAESTPSAARPERRFSLVTS